MNAYLWPSCEGKAYWIVNGRRRQREGTKLESGKIANCSGSYSYSFNSVGKTLLLGLPRKQDGRPIGYIMLLSLISPP